MFNRIGAILVSDIESMKFYKDVLGMEVKQQSGDWVEFSKQGTALHLTNEKNKLTKNTSMLIGFNINDLETVCSDLKKEKVKFHKKMTNEVPYYHGFASE